MNGHWLAAKLTLTSLLVLCFSSTALSADKAGQQDVQSEASASFGYEQVVAKAKALAAKAYTPRAKIPAFLRQANFSGWDKIEFRPEHALWQGDKIPFEIRFYHPGSYYVYPVTVHVVSNGDVKTLSFSPKQFDYPSEKIRKKVPENLGYAGIKILHHLNSPEYLDEVTSFLGASYFRALPEGAHYGLSARGLAVNTATDGGEEFPAFTDFWLVKPDPGDKALTLYALLDSPSVTGAYKFVINPGKTTTIQVEATLFTRAPIKKLGIAPLTSMFAWGENSLYRLQHARPEAHDSDGLLIHTGNGEWLWRPLRNPQRLTVNQFVTDDIVGFGLLQRDRNFFNYQHLEYEYEDRPGLWVVPKGDWGKGAVELVQIPSNSEVNDNIIAYWVPDDPVKAGERLHFAYTLKWTMHDPSSHGRATTRATRIGYAALAPGQENLIKIAIEFDGGKLGKLTDPANVTPHVSAMRDVKLHNIQAVRNPHTEGWRLSFLVPTSALGEPLELRAYLSGPGGQPLTETWTYTLTL